MPPLTFIYFNGLIELPCISILQFKNLFSYWGTFKLLARFLLIHSAAVDIWVHVSWGSGAGIGFGPIPGRCLAECGIRMSPASRDVAHSLPPAAVCDLPFLHVLTALEVVRLLYFLI